MEINCIPYEETGYFRPIMRDYLQQSEAIKPYFNRFPNIEAYKDQLEEKAKAFPAENRKILVRVLQEQYKGLKISKSTEQNLASLKSDTTFTVVTGHQLNLFTGPLYFLYKIISTINLCKALTQKYPGQDFVPVYWMATEDHDFEEISFFNIRGKKIQWNKDAAGAVGRLSTDDLEGVFKVFKSELGSKARAEELLQLFKSAYLEHPDLTSATRFLANELFGKYGLVIIDGDSAELKSLLVPYIKKDILENVNAHAVNKTLKEWEEQSLPYTVQVNPREINYFYLRDSSRERIVATADGYGVVNSDLTFTSEAMEREIEEFPERFSPNVITRPIYQEVVLPNLCYIGGGGEIAYWLQLQAAFKTQEIPFPILLHRNSALIVTRKQQKKIDNLDLSTKDLFMEKHRFINKKIREISNINIDFSSQKEHLVKQFETMYAIAEETDPTFLGAVKAQEVKQLKGLEKLEKRLLKAQKRKLKDEVVRMTEIKEELFPEGGLQERKRNFSEFYIEIGDNLIPELLRLLDPLNLQFAVLRY